MPKTVLDTYSIGLDLETSDKTKKTIADMRAAFDDTSKSLEEIDKLYRDGIQGQKDYSKEAKAYNDLLSKRMAELEKENDLIIASENEQGKAARNRLKDLKAIQSQRKLDKSEAEELKRLQKAVLDVDDAQLAILKQKNKEARNATKTAQLRLKQEQAQLKTQKTLKALIKDDLSAMDKRIKKQLEFIKALKTTEGKYKLIKKAAGIAGKGVKVGVGAAAGIVGGLVAGAVASADNLAQQERESRRIKAPLNDDDKLELVKTIQYKTGADYSSIVDAINRVHSAIHTSNKDELLEAATNEVRFPGMASLALTQDSNAGAKDIAILSARLKQIQGVTGSNADQLGSIMHGVSNLKDYAYRAGASQSDLIALYSALQGTGAYDSDDDIQKAMRRFLTQGGLTKANFYDRMQTFDWGATVRGQENKNQAIHALQSLDFGRLKTAANTTDTTAKQSAAEQMAENTRRLAAEKDKILIRVLDVVGKFLTPERMEKFFNGMDKVFKWAENNLVSEIDKFYDSEAEFFKKAEKVLPYVSPAFGLPKLIEKIGDWVDSNKGDEAGNITQKAQGGIAIAPTIVGERGAEAIIPLDYARSGRANSIMQNINQTFNMTGNQTTALSLGQAVKQRSFTDNFLNTRLYG
jgi:hypothetical protein